MYIVDPSRQLQIMKEMKQLRKDTEKYEVFFHHTMNDQMWKSFFPRATKDGLGPKLLRQEPQPETYEEMLDICLSDEVPENAIGLGIDLSTQMEIWPEIFEYLEKNRRDMNSGQLRLFLKHLQVYRYSDNLSELNIDPGDLPYEESELKKFLWRSRKLTFKSYLF